MSRFEYSEKYQDGTFEYRHVILTKDQAKQLPKNRFVRCSISLKSHGLSLTFNFDFV